jgi:hypothetical protein
MYRRQGDGQNVSVKTFISLFRLFCDHEICLITAKDCYVRFKPSLEGNKLLLVAP